MYGNFSYLPFYRHALKPPVKDGITMVLQTSADRLSRAIHIARIWKGPISLTLFVQDEQKDLQLLRDVLTRALELKQWADVHIFFDKVTPCCPGPREMELPAP